jgi:DNA-binding protein
MLMMLYTEEQKEVRPTQQSRGASVSNAVHCLGSVKNSSEHHVHVEEATSESPQQNSTQLGLHMGFHIK